MTNSGAISVAATANANALGALVGTTATAHTVGRATAIAHANGLRQLLVTAAGGGLTLTNSGTLNVLANAQASGATFADASASALGVSQFVDGASLQFTNSGSVNVSAAANAAGPIGSATASAVGYHGSAGAFGLGGNPLAVSIANSGTMDVTATASAPDNARAAAQGIVVENAATTTAVLTPRLAGDRPTFSTPMPIRSSARLAIAAR